MINQELVDYLNFKQQRLNFYPLTCCSYNSCDKLKNNKEILIATKECQICPCSNNKYNKI
jgi:hypothetical protein